MTTPPTVSAITTYAYSQLGAFSYADADYGWAFLSWLEAQLKPLQDVYDIVMDTVDGHVGGSALFDVDRCPYFALGYLAMIRGVRIPAAMTDDAKIRNLIRSATGMYRGTIPALRDAVQATLTGPQTVVIRERYDGTGDDAANDIFVETYASQTPSPDYTEAVAAAALMSGLRLTYQTTPGQDWQTVKSRFATWQDVKDGYVSWLGVRDDEPGE